MAKKLVKPEPNLCLEEFLLKKSSKYWDELERLSTDDVNSLISDLLNDEMSPFDIPLPNGDDYYKAPAGYVIALNIFVSEFLKAQSGLMGKNRSLVAGVRNRRKKGESIGRWTSEKVNVN